MTDPSMSPVAEAVLIVLVWSGRLETLPLLVLLRSLVTADRNQDGGAS